MVVEDLTLSKVGPSVEGLLRLMQSGGLVGWEEGEKQEREREEERDNQQQVQMAYLGSLEEMRAQLERMALFYQDQLDVLLSLTSLMDRVDEALSIVSKATQGYTKEELGENEDGTLKQEEEESILRQSQQLASLHHSLSHSLHHPLVVSSLHQSLVTQQVLGISGLLSKARIKAEENEGEDDDDDSEWDQPLTKEELSQLDSVSLSPAPTNNLRQSFMENIEPEPEPVASSSKSKKNRRGKCEPTLCKVCYDEFTEWSLLYTLTNCDHIYCKECLDGYLTTQITSGGVLNLGCPHPECDAEIDLVDIYAVCNKDAIDKYERFVVLAALRADPDVRWCPMNNCSAAIKGPPKDSLPWVTCGTCTLQVCFACGDERHDPAPCGKLAKALIATRRNTVQEAEDLFEAWHQGKPSDVKACPKCRAYIEKNQGCNHMTCQSCKHQFCWLCLAVYEYNHFNNDKFPDCKGKQYWYPPVPPDPELQARYNWIYFPPNYQYAGVDAGPLNNSQTRRQTREVERERVKTKAKKIGMYVGVGVAVATLGIPAVVIGGPIYGVFQLHKALKAKKRRANALSIL